MHIHYFAIDSSTLLLLDTKPRVTFNLSETEALLSAFQLGSLIIIEIKSFTTTRQI